MIAHDLGAANDLGSDHPWVCLIAYREKRAVGIWFLIREGGRTVGPVGYIRLRNAYSAFHTTHADALILPGHDYVLGAMYRTLWSFFHAVPIIAAKAIMLDGYSMRALRDPSNRFLHVDINARYQEDVIQINKTSQAYAGSLQAKFRREIFRQERNMAKLGRLSYVLACSGGPVSECLGGRAGADAGSGADVGIDHPLRFEDPLELFLLLENSGWKGAQGTSILTRDNDAKLFRNAVAWFSQHGMMHWSFLIVGNTVAAAQLGVAANDVLYLWKVAYDENFSTMGPGNVLLFRVLEHLHESKRFKCISFMNERAWLAPFVPSKHAMVDCTIRISIPGVESLVRLMRKIRRTPSTHEHGTHPA
jgi:hypothetical protein